MVTTPTTLIHVHLTVTTARAGSMTACSLASAPGMDLDGADGATDVAGVTVAAGVMDAADMATAVAVDTDITEAATVTDAADMATAQAVLERAEFTPDMAEVARVMVASPADSVVAAVLADSAADTPVDIAAVMLADSAAVGIWAVAATQVVADTAAVTGKLNGDSIGRDGLRPVPFICAELAYGTRTRNLTEGNVRNLPVK